MGYQANFFHSESKISKMYSKFTQVYWTEINNNQITECLYKSGYPTGVPNWMPVLAFHGEKIIHPMDYTQGMYSVLFCFSNVHTDLIYILQANFTSSHATVIELKTQHPSSEKRYINGKVIRMTPWSPLGTSLKARFDVPSDDQTNHPDDLFRLSVP